MNESFQDNTESLEKPLLPKELFALQVQFAHEVAQLHDVPLREALLKYTSAHARMFHHPTKGTAEGWEEFVAELPNTPGEIVDHVYAVYVAKEEAAEALPDMETFGCFSHQYKEARNTFVLHFGNNDTAGNLGQDRIEAREKDLRKLTESIADHKRVDAYVQMTSWLLSINAFNRLLPPAFVEAIENVEQDAAQDNGLWGQFLDKDGGVKAELVEQLIANIRSGEMSPADCFPSKLKTAKVPQEVFFARYL